MRLWSIHPKYLDSKGLIALWREALLAKHVFNGKTKGYKNHPQLSRFKEIKNTLDVINTYLLEIYEEAVARRYNFDKSKIDQVIKTVKMTVTAGQLDYEIKHLKKKLAVRDKCRFEQLGYLKDIETFNLFTVIPGDIAKWEILSMVQ